MKPGGKPGGAGGLLRDKRVQIGAAAAVALGLVALLRRGGSVDGGAVIQPAAGVDSSGTDLYNALQQFNEGLTDIRDLLDQRPGTGTGSDPGKGNPPPAKPPATTIPPPSKGPIPKPKPVPGKDYVWSTRYTKTNTSWASTLSGIAGHYKTSVPALMKLNPSIKNPNVIGVHQYIRLR